MIRVAPALASRDDTSLALMAQPAAWLAGPQLP
jgi:hypothetical protein